jgi:hypothetical protein
MSQKFLRDHFEMKNAIVFGSSGFVGWLNGTVAWIGKASRDAMRNNVEELSRVWLIGSIVRNYAARYSGDKPSERELRVFERWSIRFSAVYYEAKEREKETKGHTSA